MYALHTLAQDLRYALRLLRRSPVFTIVALLSLTAAIGANTAIFSVVNAVMLRELPVRDPEQLVEMVTTYPGDPRMNYFGWKFYEHYREHNHVFSHLTGMSPARVRVGGGTTEAEAVDVAYIVSDFFPALGVQPLMGRLIGPGDDQLSGHDAAVAVVSWSFWQIRFGLDPSIIGQRIVLTA